MLYSAGKTLWANTLVVVVIGLFGRIGEVDAGDSAGCLGSQ